jgi:carboxymethylenebutenolidase
METPAAIARVLDRYQSGEIHRRDLFRSLNRLLGGYAAAHLFLESSGVAPGMLAAQESAKANVDSETVHYAGPAGQIEAYLARPKPAGSYPGIIVIHENRGLNEHTRDVARRFAAEGFVALAPDALSRRGTTARMESVEKAREAIGTLTPAETIADLKAGLRYLEGRKDVDRTRISSIGFCWGGARSFLLATEWPNLYRAVVFYGTPPPQEKLAAIPCPVLGIYGEEDRRITSTVPETAEAMKKLGKKYEYKIYPGANHAFFNDTGDRYNAEAAHDAWARTLAFLRS